MSTTSKGDKFELRTKDILARILSDGDFELKVNGRSDFWIVPKNASIYNKKKYTYVYGRKVIIDISLENSTNDETPYLVIVECKDLSRKVDTSDMGEFCLKVQDLKAKKGVFVTNKGFQRGAVEMAKYHNIALIRIDEKNDVIWDLHRIGNRHTISYDDAVNMLYSDTSQWPTLIVDGFSFCNSILDYFYSLLNYDDSLLSNNIPFYSNAEIQEKVNQFVDNNSYVKMRTDILKICMLKNGIGFDENTDCMGLLGRYVFFNNQIFISKSLIDEVHRYRFTLAHEIGHSVLHRELLKHYVSSAEDKDVLTYTYSSNWEKRLEIQANTFASFLLIPKAPLINYYMEIKRNLGINDDVPLYLDNQPCNKKDCLKMFYALSKIFNVSKEAIMYRLINSKLLKINKSFNECF